MPYLGAHRCLINTCGKKPLGGRLSVAPAGGSLLRLLCRPALHRRILVAAKRNINDAGAGDDDDEEDAGSKAGRPNRSAAAMEAEAAEAEATAELYHLSSVDAADEESPKRFPYHRRLLEAAQRGAVEEAEEAMESMREAGLPPGPRATHSLLYAYVKRGDAAGALEVAQAAAADGLELLSDSYVALIYAFLNSDPPDVATAEAVLQSLKDAGRDAIPGWRMLCSQLFAKGLVREGMAAVKGGLDAGLVPDPALATHVIQQLCEAGLVDRAIDEMDRLAEEGHTIAAQHYNPILRALAQRDVAQAEKFLEDRLRDPRCTRPNVDTYNALLEGVVKGLVARDSDMFYAFMGMRDRMLKNGIRPDKNTYRLFVEGYVKLRDDVDYALNAYDSLTKTAVVGGTKLLSKDALATLLQWLGEEARPVDMFRLLEDCVADNQPLPRKALAANPSGLTLVSSWLPSRMEALRQRALQRREGGGEVEEEETFRWVDDVRIGLGDCAVDDNGEAIAPGKMSIAALRVEAEVRGLTGTEDMKKTELAAAIKAARAKLPVNVLEAQKRAVASRKERQKREKAEMDASMEEETDEGAEGAGAQDAWAAEADEAAAYANRFKIVTNPPKKQKLRGKTRTITYNVSRWRNNKLLGIKTISEEVPAGRSVTKVRSDSGTSDEDLSLLLREEGGEEEEEEDALGDILTSGLEEGVADIIRGDDMYEADGEEPAAEEGEEEGEEPQDEEEDDELRIAAFDARAGNAGAGMTEAMALLKSVELLRGRPSVGDYRVLVSGAIAEQNLPVAVELAQRLHRLMKMGADRDEVAGLYASLARMCLDLGRTDSADDIIAAAERHRFPVDDRIMAALMAALGGRERRAQANDAQLAELVEDIDELDEDVEGEEEEDEEPADIDLEAEEAEEGQEEAGGWEEPDAQRDGASAGPAPCEDAAVSAASLAQLRKLLGSGGLGLESSLVEELVRGEAQDARDLRLTVEGATDSAEADAALEVGEMQSARDVPEGALVLDAAVGGMLPELLQGGAAAAADDSGEADGEEYVEESEGGAAGDNDLDWLVEDGGDGDGDDMDAILERLVGSLDEKAVSEALAAGDQAALSALLDRALDDGSADDVATLAQQVERQLLDRFGGVAPGPSFFYSLRPPSTSQDEQFEMYQIFDDMVEVADDGEVGVGSGRHGNKQ